MNKLNLCRTLAALLLSVFVSSCDSQAREQGAGGPPPAPKVTVATPVVKNVDEFKEFSGRFEASESIEIRARVSGYLTEANFKEGAIVKKGDPLFTIDPRPFEAALKKADADVKVAQSRIAFTKGNYERAQALFTTGDISAQIRDQRLQERDQAVAELDRARAAREQAALELSYSHITAPITGRIGQKLVDQGNFVTGGANGSTVLATVVALDPIYFYFDIDEATYIQCARHTAESGKDRVEYDVAVALADEKDYSHKGRTDFINNALDTSTGSMRARATLTNEDMFLTPGMFGRVRVMLGTSSKAIQIPDAAIQLDQSRKFVYTVDANGLVTSQTIETGTLSDDGMRVVTKGLKGDEKVIINGLQRAHDGATVSLEAAPAPAPEGAPQ